MLLSHLYMTANFSGLVQALQLKVWGAASFMGTNHTLCACTQKFPSAEELDPIYVPRVCHDGLLTCKCDMIII